MSTSSCRPENLLKFVTEATGRSEQVVTRAGQLETALNAYVTRCGGDYCTEAADQASIVRAWGMGYHALAAWTAKVAHAFENADAAARRAHPAEGQEGPVKTFDDMSLGEAGIADAVARVHRALDTAGLGVTASDLDAIRDVFDRLSPDERKALVMRLSTHDLEVWGDQMTESRYKGGWSIQERDAFFSKLLPQLGTDAIDRLASTNPYLRPKFHGKREYGEADWRKRTFSFPEVDDITQGHTSDCYFLAALGAVAHKNPDLVRDMVRRNDNGTYTVTFHERGSWDAKASTFEVTVLPEFPGGLRDEPAQDDDRFYMQIIEKAWAQHGEGYDKVGDSRPGIPLEFITGHESSYSSVSGSRPGLGSFDPIQTALNDGRAVTATTPMGLPKVPFPEIEVLRSDGQTKATVTIPYSHVYIVTGVRDVEKAGQMLVLRNPWGGDNAEFMLTISQFRQLFVFYTEVPSGARNGRGTPR